MSLFNDNIAGSIGEPLNKYLDKKPSQETPGVFCPTSIDFSQTFDSNLIIVNSCPASKDSIDKQGTDRRLITFRVTPEGYEILDKGSELGLDTKNEFIRKKSLNGDNLHICADKEMNFVANIGTRFVYGIGIKTH